MFVKAYNQQYDTGARLSDFLNPVWYDNGIYLLSDGGLALAYEFTSVSVDGLSPDELLTKTDRIGNMIAGLPRDMDYQYLMCVVPDTELTLEPKTDNSVLIEWGKRRMAYHKKGKFFTWGGYQVTPKEIIHLFIARYTPKWAKDIKFSELLFGNYPINDKLYKEASSHLLSAVTVIDSGIINIGNKKTLLQPNRFIDILYRFFNPNRCMTTAAPKWDKQEAIRDYYICSESAIDEGQVCMDGFNYRVFSLKHNPSVMGDDGLMYSMPNMLFRESAGISPMDYCPVLLYSVSFAFANEGMEKAKIEGKRFLSVKHGNEAGKPTLINELNVLREQMFQAGSVLLKARYFFVMGSPENEIDSKSQVLTQQIKNNCGILVEERELGARIINITLPFGFRHDIPSPSFLKRDKLTTNKSLASLLLWGYSAGNSLQVTDDSVSIPFYNRRTGKMGFNPFSPDTSVTAPHSLVLGETGSGKSVTMNYLIAFALYYALKVFVIDKGNSYLKLNRILKGQYTRFEEKPEYSLNPFVRDTHSEDYHSYLVSLFSLMISGGVERVMREEVGIIDETVYEALKSNVSKIEDFIEILKKKPMGESLARRMSGFYGVGRFSRFFSNELPSIDIKNPFVCFELGKSNTYQDLQAVVVMSLLNSITNFVRNTQGFKLLIIDEAWSLLMHEAALNYLMEAVKTFRKYGCCVILTTQQIEDFMVFAKAINIPENCPNAVCLKQKGGTGVDKILGFTEGQGSMLKDVSKTSMYAEMLFKSNWTGMGRLCLDPFSYWQFTSEEADNSYLYKLIEGGMKIEEAIDKCSNEFPYGIRYGQ